jgi:hypothetical protein
MQIWIQAQAHDGDDHDGSENNLAHDPNLHSGKTTRLLNPLSNRHRVEIRGRFLGRSAFNHPATESH